MAMKLLTTATGAELKRIFGLAAALWQKGKRKGVLKVGEDTLLFLKDKVIHTAPAYEGTTFYASGGATPYSFYGGIATDVSVSGGRMNGRRVNRQIGTATRLIYLLRRAGDFSAHHWLHLFSQLTIQDVDGIPENIVSAVADGAYTKVHTTRGYTLRTYRIPRDAKAPELVVSALSMNPATGAASLALSYMTFAWNASTGGGTVLERHEDNTVAVSKIAIPAFADFPATGGVTARVEGLAWVYLRRTQAGAVTVEVENMAQAVSSLRINGRTVYRLDLLPYLVATTSFSAGSETSHVVTNENTQSTSPGPGDTTNSYWYARRLEHTYSYGGPYASSNQIASQGHSKIDTTSTGSVVYTFAGDVGFYSDVVSYVTSGSSSKEQGNMVHKRLMLVGGELVTRIYNPVFTGTYTMTSSEEESGSSFGWENTCGFDPYNGSPAQIGNYTYSFSENFSPAPYRDAIFFDVFGAEYSFVEKEIVVSGSRTTNTTAAVFQSCNSRARVGTVTNSTYWTLSVKQRPLLGGWRANYVLPEIGLFWDADCVYHAQAGLLYGAPPPDIVGEKISSGASLGATGTGSGSSSEVHSDVIPFVGGPFTNTANSSYANYAGVSVSTAPQTFSTNGATPPSRVAIFCFPDANTTYAAVFSLGVLLRTLRLLSVATTYTYALNLAEGARQSLITQAASAENPAEYTGAADTLALYINAIQSAPVNWAAITDEFVAEQLPYQMNVLWTNVDVSGVLDLVTDGGIFVAGPFREKY